METRTLKYGDEIFENYTISEDGVLTNIKNNRIMHIGITRNGYPSFNININNKFKRMLVHKAMFCSFNPKIQIPEGYHIHHINGDKTNFSLRNLQLIEKAVHASFKKKEQKAYKYFAKIKGMKDFAEIKNLTDFCKSVNITNVTTLRGLMLRDSKCTHHNIEFYREEIIGEN